MDQELPNRYEQRQIISSWGIPPASVNNSLFPHMFISTLAAAAKALLGKFAENSWIKVTVNNIQEKALALRLLSNIRV